MPLPLLAVAQISDALQHRPLVAVPLLFVAGLVTSLNPCIYPMIPITAGALAGVNAEGRTRRRTVGLTLTYVTGLALFYALLGMIAGLTGSLFGTIGASVWARLVIGNLLLVFALAMLDLIRVRFPAIVGLGRQFGRRLVSRRFAAGCDLGPGGGAVRRARIRGGPHVGSDDTQRRAGLHLSLRLFAGHDGGAGGRGVVLWYAVGFAAGGGVDGVDQKR